MREILTKEIIFFLAHIQIYRAQEMLLKSEVLSTYDIYMKQECSSENTELYKKASC